jgi:hypothetical protein
LGYLEAPVKAKTTAGASTAQFSKNVNRSAQDGNVLDGWDFLNGDSPFAKIGTWFF